MAVPAWAERYWEFLAPYVEPLAFWRGYEAEIQTLGIYAVGIALYTVLVFTFYQQISKREPFGLKSEKGWRGFFRRVFLGGILFPLFSFLYFGVLSLSLFVLAKEGTTTYQILVLAMSVIVGVRVTATLSESAAVDLAKMLPLGLLGVMIVDPSYANLSTILTRFSDTPALIPILWRFFAVFIVLEGTLNLARAIRAQLKKRRATRGARKLTKDEILGDLSRTVVVKENEPAEPRPRKP